MTTMIRKLHWTLIGRRAQIRARIDAIVIDFEVAKAKQKKRRFPSPSSGNTAS
jgi:hypothetical protein